MTQQAPTQEQIEFTTIHVKKLVDDFFKTYLKISENFDGMTEIDLCAYSLAALTEITKKVSLAVAHIFERKEMEIIFQQDLIKRITANMEKQKKSTTIGVTMSGCHNPSVTTETQCDCQCYKGMPKYYKASYPPIPCCTCSPFDGISFTIPPKWNSTTIAAEADASPMVKQMQALEERIVQLEQQKLMYKSHLMDEAFAKIKDIEQKVDSHNHQLPNEILGRLISLESSPFAKSKTYAPLFERMDQLEARLRSTEQDMNHLPSFEVLNEYAQRLVDLDESYNRQGELLLQNRDNNVATKERLNDIQEEQGEWKSKINAEIVLANQRLIDLEESYQGLAAENKHLLERAIHLQESINQLDHQTWKEKVELQESIIKTQETTKNLLTDGKLVVEKKPNKCPVCAGSGNHQDQTPRLMVAVHTRTGIICCNACEGKGIVWS